MPHTIAFKVLCGFAAALWVLYFCVALRESGKVGWIKRRLVDVLVVLSIACVTFLVNVLLSSMGSHHHR